MITTILFDLDGTLLPLEEKPFLDLYFGLMARRFAALGHDPKALIRGLFAGTEAMRKNRGPSTNETVFWNEFVRHFPAAGSLMGEFERFYQEDFDAVQASSHLQPLARHIIDLLHEKKYGIALATNPLFPRIATEKRIRWAGLRPEDFLMITTYENSRATKPSPCYFQAVLEAIGKTAGECLMIGNDAYEDMAAGLLGMETYLVTDGLINEKAIDLSQIRSGSFEDLHQMIESLPTLK